MFDLLWRFQQLRDAAEALIVEKEAKSFETDLSVADVLVTVDSRSERLLRIVEMEKSHIADADVFFNRLDRLFIAGARAQFIARRENVTGIEADADALA